MNGVVFLLCVSVAFAAIAIRVLIRDWANRCAIIQQDREREIYNNGFIEGLMFRGEPNRQMYVDEDFNAGLTAGKRICFERESEPSCN